MKENNEVIPLEVKEETNLKAKSLNRFRKDFNPKISIRTSLADYEFNGGLYNIPFYAINYLSQILAAK